jgi:hypothetical protein
MSLRDHAQGILFWLLRESAIASMLFIYRCRDGVLSRSPFTFIKGRCGTDLGHPLANPDLVGLFSQG